MSPLGRQILAGEDATPAARPMGDEPLSAARRAELLGMTPLGRAVADADAK